jgi:hypothetical protein
VKPPVPTRFLHVSGITPEILTEFAVAASCKNDSSATISAPKPPLQALFESFGALDEEGGLEILEGKVSYLHFAFFFFYDELWVFFWLFKLFDNRDFAGYATRACFQLSLL